MNNLYKNIILEKTEENKKIEQIIKFVENRAGDKIKLKTNNPLNMIKIDIERMIFLQIIKELKNYNENIIRDYTELLNKRN